MPIKVGDRIPEAKFRVMTESGPAWASTDDVFTGKTVVLFAVPGAFTPTCSNSHLPGFIRRADEIKAKGVDTIALTAVNDIFVLTAWQKATGADGKITFLADGNAEFATAVDMMIDISGGGLGLRSKRYAMLVEDGVVKRLSIEPEPGKAEATSAEAMLAEM